VKRSFTSKSRMGLVALLALMASVPALAEIKIGYVDSQRLLEESPQAKAVSESLKSEFGPRQRDLQTQLASRKAREDKLQKDAATMSDDQKARAEGELRNLDRELARKQSEFQDDLNARRNEEISRLQRTLIEEVRAYAKAQSYDLVVSDALYATPAVDITAAVLASLQAHGGAAHPAPSSGAAKPSSGK
jgi:outer membrane protein